MSRGFRPLKAMGSGSSLQGATLYKKEASVVMAPGAVVVATGSAEADTGIPLVTLATAGAGNRITGVVAAIDPDRSDLRKKFLAAAESGYVYVYDDPDMEFVADEDDGSLVVGDVGQGIDFIGTSYDSTFGHSTSQLDSDSTGSGGTEQFILLRKYPEINNDIGDTNCKWVVKMNYVTRSTAV